MQKKAFMGIGKALAGGANAVKDATLLGHALAALGAVGGGYALSRATSPTHLADNADKEIVLNALETNLATAQRRIADLKARKQRREAEAGEKRNPYDVVLN